MKYLPYTLGVIAGLVVAGRLFKAYDDMMFYDWGFYE